MPALRARITTCKTMSQIAMYLKNHVFKIRCILHAGPAHLFHLVQNHIKLKSNFLKIQCIKNPSVRMKIKKNRKIGNLQTYY